MITFLLTFFSLYGAAHIYFFLKLRDALSFGVKAGVPLAAAMALMVSAPVLVRLSEKAGYDLLAHVMSYSGYLWMGVVFLFISVSLPLEIYRAIVRMLEFAAGREYAALKPSSRFVFLFPLGTALCISMYGYFEALHVRTERITIRTPKLASDVGTLKIAQISDVHLGLIVGESRLKRILQAVTAEDPDILVSTGDLVDGQINNLRGLAEMLGEVKPRLGKFAITGNHEFYAGLSDALSFTRRAGFMVLRGRAENVSGLISIVGVDDSTVRYFSREPAEPEHDLLKSLPRDRFTVLLKHRPLVSRDSLGFFDLQLSGHTHKGQIFPFSLVTWLYYPVHAGCLNPVDDCHLYVSRGSGTWGPPVRFLSPPEVTIIELVGTGVRPPALPLQEAHKRGRDVI